MTQARSLLIPNDTAGVYHCAQRCVRRAWLCGVDEYTGESFEHRKLWVEARISLIGECFATAIHAYAVMSNHLHLVLEMNPAVVGSWSDEDVASRWVKLFPPREPDAAAVERKQQRLIGDTPYLQIIRTRLSNLSWFMKCLAEPIARMANAEDICKGRFWEGRFKSQVLKDERALLAAMAYVDLNPIRAARTKRLDHSRHTSIHERITHARAQPRLLTRPLAPVCGTIQPIAMNLNLRDYIELVEWTGKQIRGDKKAFIHKAAPSVIATIESSGNGNRWATRVKGVGSMYYRVIGDAQDLLDVAKDIGQSWLKGIGFAISLEKMK